MRKLFLPVLLAFALLPTRVQAKPHHPKTVMVSPQRAAMNRFLKAVQSKDIKAIINLVSPAKEINYPGLQASETRADILKFPDSCLIKGLLFDTDYPGFLPAREFPKIQWVLAGDKFVPTKGGKDFQKSDVFVRFALEGKTYKLVEIGTPIRADAG